MTPLKERLEADLRVATKAQDPIRRETIRLSLAAIHYEEVARRGPLDEAVRSGAIKFGLRPEHVSAVPRPQGDGFEVPASVRFMEHMGSEVFVHFDIGSVPLTARVPADQLNGLAEKLRGEVHHFHLQLASCHLFDAETGANLLL